MKLLKDKSGNGVIMALCMVLMLSLLAYPIAVFAQSVAQVGYVKRVSQNTLDRYTIKSGKTVINSIKSGNDYTSNVDEVLFTKDFTDELNIATKLIAYNNSGQEIFKIKNLKVTFIVDKSLTTTAQFTLEYQYYFLSIPLFKADVTLKLESRYNLK